MLDFPLFDADNHYYEATDAFTRHLDRSMQKRAMEWATVGGKQRLLVGGTVNRFLPNPAFTHLAPPGSLADFFRAKEGVGDMRSAFGELKPIEEHPEYRDRAARLKVMDAQGLEATIMLPTLGVGMEAALEHDVEALTAAFTAFNLWLDEDWGYNHEDRIYASPYITLTDPDWALAELERLLEAGTTSVLLRPASVATPTGRVTPGHVRHDKFWQRVNDAGIAVVLHSGDASYAVYEQMWGLTGEMEAFRIPTLKRLLSASPIRDTVASLFADQFFDRFPNIRLTTIETGSGWVKGLLKKLKSVHVQVPGAFKTDPVEQFNTNVWVSPFFEDDVLALVNLVGAERVVFGSDWPHVEGLSEPASFIKELPGVSDSDVRLIMHDNARALMTPRR